MGAVSAVRLRSDLHTRILNARARTDELFGIVREEAMYERPIAERHRIIFYVGHVEAFDWNLLAQRAFGLKSFHPSFDKLFAFGIDPVGGGLPTDEPADWPARDEVERYNQKLRGELDQAIERALRRPSEGHPQLVEMLEVAVEHRLMHAETLAYMLHHDPPSGAAPRRGSRRRGSASRRRRGSPRSRGRRRRRSGEQRRHLLGVDAELLRAAAHPHAGALDLEVGVDADRDARADAELARRSRWHAAQLGRATRSRSSTPAATAWRSSARRLARPGEADAARPASPVSSATRISPAGGDVERSRPRRARCWTTAGIGLAFIA